MYPGQEMASDGFEIGGWKRPLQGEVDCSDWRENSARKLYRQRSP